MKLYARPPDILGRSSFSNTTIGIRRPHTGIHLRAADPVARATADAYHHHDKEESQSAEAHFQSSSVFLLVLLEQIMLLMRVLIG